MSIVYACKPTSDLGKSGTWYSNAPTVKETDSVIHINTLVVMSDSISASYQAIELGKAQLSQYLDSKFQLIIQKVDFKPQNSIEFQSLWITHKGNLLESTSQSDSHIIFKDGLYFYYSQLSLDVQSVNSVFAILSIKINS